jgi:hypothetical protein
MYAWSHIVNEAIKLSLGGTGTKLGVERNKQRTRGVPVAAKLGTQLETLDSDASSGHWRLHIY